MCTRVCACVRGGDVPAGARHIDNSVIDSDTGERRPL